MVNKVARDQGAFVGSAGGLFIHSVTFEGPRSGGIRSAWDQSAEWKQGP